MTMHLKSCTRCSVGDLLEYSDMFGRYTQCDKCGFVRDLPSEPLYVATQRTQNPSIRETVDEIESGRIPDASLEGVVKFNERAHQGENSVFNVDYFMILNALEGQHDSTSILGIADKTGLGPAVVDKRVYTMNKRVYTMNQMGYVNIETIRKTTPLRVISNKQSGSEALKEYHEWIASKEESDKESVPTFSTYDLVDGDNNLLPFGEYLLEESEEKFEALFEFLKELSTRNQ